MLGSITLVGESFTALHPSGTVDSERDDYGEVVLSC